jgi:exodeoxyribonuclease V beta subunit
VLTASLQLSVEGLRMLEKNLAYEASAGSGKTFMLVVRYLSLLFLGALPSKILALTFTNKAAYEMQERIVATLEALESRGELDVISEVTELSKSELLAQRDRILSEFLNANTKIMTIDKFFTQILRKFSLYTSLMPDFTTQSSQHERKLLSRFLKEVDVAGKKETLIQLSLESSKRLESIFSLLDALYSKKHELSKIEFHKQKSFVYEEEALIYLKELQALVNGSEAASSTAKKSVDVESFEELCTKSWVAKETLNYRTFSKCYVPEMDRLLTKIQEAIKQHNRAREQNFFYALKELVDIYEKSKKALYMDDSELSFNDVTMLVYYLLKERIDSEFLYFRLDAQIEHILLDEFQDTSILQYEILKPLIAEIVSGNGVKEEGSFFFVGDVKQSIYRFRGGVSALFAKVALENHTRVEPLLTNYRSQKEVIDFVNTTFENKISNYLPQQTREEAQGGYVEVIACDALLECCVAQVQRLLDLGADIDEIAILCATNGDGEEIKNALEAQKIEVVTETTTKLIHQQSIKAVLEYLKYQYFKEDIYRYNFFALIHKDVEPLEFLDLNSLGVADIVKHAIDRYTLFSDEFHLIRFLDALGTYPDIEALLFEYERLDLSGAASDLRGVRVLTVHKSKGLEYEHVIVLDRLKKAPPARDTIIYEYDGIDLEGVYLRIKGRDALDKPYENALLKEKKLAREDTLNALYVAFTRARENLFVLLKSKDSAFDLLDLTPKVQGKLVCKPSQEEISHTQASLSYKSLYYGTQSDILEHEKEKEEDLSAIHFGLGLHYMLEMLSSFEVRSIENAKNMLLNRYGALLSNEEIHDICSRIEMLLNNKEFLSLVDGECMKEKALKYKKNLRYIDLLVKKEQQDPQALFPRVEYTVIDYKSAMSFAQEHHKQVSYYKKAIAEITSDEVCGYICYLLKDEIKIVKV